MNIEEVNNELRHKSPTEIIQWALGLNKKTVITTNFRPYEGVILHAVSRVKNEVQVIWCDTGYNTSQTYKHALKLIDKLGLNIEMYVPHQTVAYRNAQMGIPDVHNELHKKFTEQVKLEPFRRAMNAHRPEVWFTNLRKNQTEFRNSIDVISLSADGIIKVSPFYNYSDAELDAYLETHNIPNETKYYDPTKVLENRECGLHA
jgi:phosphoadenosine phosphosulfate reductase